MCADVFVAGRAYAADVVAGENGSFVVVDKADARGTRFLFDDDLDGAAVACCGAANDVFDSAGAFAGAGDAGDVVGAGVVIEFEFEADGVVGVGGSGARFCGGEVPEADGASSFWELASVDLFEPVALEEVALVGDVPVAVEEPFSFGVGEVGEGRDIGVAVEEGVVVHAGGEEDRPRGSCVVVDEVALDPAVTGAAGIACCSYADGDVAECGAVRSGGLALRCGCLPDDAEHAPVDVLGEAGEFIEAEEREGAPLVAVDISKPVEVAEAQRRAAGAAL